MNPVHLVTALAEDIRAAVKNIRLPREYMRQADNQRGVNVYEQYLPADLFEADDYYPCVIVELLELHDDLQVISTATVGLSFGVFAKEEDAWKDCFHLWEVVRQHLLEHRTIARRFRLKDCVWQTAQNQPTPFFFSYAQLEYEIYQPQERFF